MNRMLNEAHSFLALETGNGKFGWTGYGRVRGGREMSNAYGSCILCGVELVAVAELINLSSSRT